jgi:hypothetical protein
MLKLAVKCPKHPRYNPAKDGEGAIRGSCRICLALFTLWRDAVDLEHLGEEVREKRKNK